MFTDSEDDEWMPPVRAIPKTQPQPTPGLVSTVVYAVVAKSFSPKSPVACIVTDKHGNCYYLKRGFTRRGQPFLMHLETKHAVWFTKPEGEQNGRTPIINDIDMCLTKLYEKCARLIRGNGIHRNKVFMHDFKAIITLDDPCSIFQAFTAPEGVPFLGGVHFELTKYKNKIVSKPTLSFFYWFTSENIDFYDCPWPIEKKNLWSNLPDYSVTPPVINWNPWVRKYARCMRTEGLIASEKILYVVPDGVWINLWKNSKHLRDELAEVGYAISIQEFVEGGYYEVEVLQSWITGNFYELNAWQKDKFGEEDEEGTKYLDRFFEKVDPHFHQFDLKFYDDEHSS